MLFWIILAALAGAVGLALMRSPGCAAPLPGHDSDAAVYKDQLAELDADAARGLIPREEAASARAEIARRLLKATDETAPASAPFDAASSSPILTLAAAAIPLLSVALYLQLGSPGLPARPLSARMAAPISAAGTPDAVNDMLVKVEAELHAHPDDARGWTVIAPVYLSQGRAAESADAYALAIKHGGETVERLTGLAKAHLVLGTGIVDAIAREAYLHALKLDADLPEARFWLAVYEEQNGRPATAIEAYKAFLATLSPDAPWRGPAEERLAALSAPNAPKAGPAGPQATDDASRKEPSPAEFVAAAQKLAPQMREAMIGGRMIPKAQDAVKKNPKDVSAWSRIVTGHAALGHASEARSALQDARKAAAGDPPMLSSLDTLARDLGLNS